MRGAFRAKALSFHSFRFRRNGETSVGKQTHLRLTQISIHSVSEETVRFRASGSSSVTTPGISIHSVSEETVSVIRISRKHKQKLKGISIHSVSEETVRRR